jgi:hypothetical protein
MANHITAGLSKKNTIDVKQSATFVMSGVRFPVPKAVWYCNYDIVSPSLEDGLTTQAVRGSSDFIPDEQVRRAH